MNVAGILTDKGGDVFAISPEDTVRAAAQALDEKGVGAMVVLDPGGEVVGVVSERDIACEVARHGAASLESRVVDCMSRDVVTASPTDTVDHLMNLMTDRRIRHLPVIDEGKLVGVVSIGDVVKRKVHEAEADADALRTYITAG